jgi:hypothetical protein
LVGDELIEIRVGEHATRALRAVADDDVAERARIDVAVERLDRAGELRCGFGWRAQAIGRANARRARALRCCWYLRAQIFQPDEELDAAIIKLAAIAERPGVDDLAERIDRAIERDDGGGFSGRLRVGHRRASRVGSTQMPTRCLRTSGSAAFWDQLRADASAGARQSKSSASD